MRRPFSTAAAALTAAHHTVELTSGIGLVLQPELGLAGSLGLWGLQLPAWLLLSTREDRRVEGPLALFSGAALAGALVHFALWPTRRSAVGLPVLAEAEGLPIAALPAYNTVLYAWGATAALSLAHETPRRLWPWALLGLATFPLQWISARHHFTWIHDEALHRPAWWNRAIVPRVSGTDQERL